MGIEPQTKNRLPEVSLHLGIIGSVSFIFFILIFLEDWTERYSFLWAIIPIPAVILWIARKIPMLGGFLLVVLAASAVVFDMIFSPAHPGQITGRGLGYTLVCVSLPLIVSGGLFAISGFNNRDQSK